MPGERLVDTGLIGSKRTTALKDEDRRLAGGIEGLGYRHRGRQAFSASLPCQPKILGM